MSSLPLPARTSRRRMMILGLTLAALVSGCATPPPPPPPAPAPKFTLEQVRTMRDLGFVETDEGWTLSMGSRVLFGFGADRLGPDEVETVARLTDSLIKVGLTRVRVEGHTDSIGDAAVNQRLSLRRARSPRRSRLRRHGPRVRCRAPPWPRPRVRCLPNVRPSTHGRCGVATPCTASRARTPTPAPPSTRC